MKKLLLLLLLATSFSCGSSDEPAPDCGTYNGKQLHSGPKGGCYYINNSGNNEYVDWSHCNC